MDSGNSNAAKGEWIDEKQFKFSIKPLNDMAEVSFEISFDRHGITVDVSDMWGTMSQKGKLK